MPWSKAQVRSAMRRGCLKLWALALLGVFVSTLMAGYFGLRLPDPSVSVRIIFWLASAMVCMGAALLSTFVQVFLLAEDVEDLGHVEPRQSWQDELTGNGSK